MASMVGALFSTNNGLGHPQESARLARDEWKQIQKANAAQAHRWLSLPRHDPHWLQFSAVSMQNDQRNSANERCSLSGDLANQETRFPRSDSRQARLSN